MLFISHISELPGPETFVPLSPDLFEGRGLSAAPWGPIRPIRLPIHTAAAYIAAQALLVDVGQ